jgi:hypothetical protein
MSHFMRITAQRELSPGNVAVNTFHFSADGAGLTWVGLDKVSTANGLITKLKNFYTALGTAGLAGQWEIGTVVTEHETGQDTRFIGATPQSSTPSSGSETFWAVAAVIQWKTGLAGKSNRGRSYIGPLKNSATSAPGINTGTYFGLATAAQEYLDGTFSTLAPCVYSPTREAAGQPSTTLITLAACPSRIATLRTRAS